MYTDGYDMICELLHIQSYIELNSDGDCSHSQRFLCELGMSLIYYFVHLISNTIYPDISIC